MMLGIKYPTGYSCCSRCKVKGTRIQVSDDAIVEESSDSDTSTSTANSNMPGTSGMGINVRTARSYKTGRTRNRRIPIRCQKKSNHKKKRTSEKTTVVRFLDHEPCEPRTDAEALDRNFRLNDMEKPSTERHFTGTTPLMKIDGIQLVSRTPLDYMHLICLGVVRTLVSLWITPESRDKLKIQRESIENINKKSSDIQNSIPLPFGNTPNELKANWKATQARAFLLYLGPVVLKEELPFIIYDNFMKLSKAIRIGCSPKLCKSHVSLMRQLLREFVSEYHAIYGNSRMVYNIHNCLHLADDVELYAAALDIISNFVYENHIFHMKTYYLKSSTFPAAQTFKRDRKRSDLFS
ncbi:unnamed protein product [Bemisia tabaci]|uniref:Uncharacterized protein n=1 Tax=Bemisia tabaci TaxID=7038 RepID=A0A9P0F5U6_BEMTA|nr:unnamed protein product [Bemisia tabaci]